MGALIILTVVAATGDSSWTRTEHYGWRPLLTQFETETDCVAVAKRIQPANWVCVKQAK